MQPEATTYPMRLTVEEVTRLVDEHFPQVHEGTGGLSVEALAPSRAEATCASISLTSCCAARLFMRMKFHIALLGLPLR